MISKAMDPESSLYSSRTRCFALDNSDYLIVEQANTAASLSADVAKEIGAVGAHASSHSVLLWNSNNQIEGLFDLDQVGRVPIRDFTPIRAVGIAPELGHRLGNWTRQHRREDGLWSVNFERLADHVDPVNKIFEEQVLLPWIEQRIDADCFIPWGAIELKRYEDLTRAQKNMRRLLDNCIFIPADEHHLIVSMSAGTGKTALAVRLLKELAQKRHLKRFVVKSSEEIKRFQMHVSHALAGDENTADLTQPTTQPGSHAEQSVDALISNLLENTTEALNVVSKALSTAGASKPESASDPIQNAIEIREQLRQNVPLLDAAKWAKWRGTPSKNPSAALGKYKRQNRVFAVRVGNRDLYPRFQFSDNAEPLAVIEEVLRVVPKDAQGWPLLSWFEAGNAVLKDRKPSDLVASAPLKVLEAARRFYSRDD